MHMRHISQTGRNDIFLTNQTNECDSSNRNGTASPFLSVTWPMSHFLQNLFSQFSKLQLIFIGGIRKAVSDAAEGVYPPKKLS